MSWREIEPRERDLLDALNGGDASGVARHYTEDARLLPPNADILQGRAAVEEFFSALTGMGASLALTLVGTHEAPELCVEVGRYELAFRPPGGEPATDSGKFLVVWTRAPDGAWLIAEDMFNSSLPAPGT